MKATRRFVTSVVLVAIVVAGLLATVIVGGMKPKLGLDLQGGLSVVLTAPKGTPSDKVDEAVNILRNRIDRAGVGEPQISREGSNNVLIEIPGVKDPQALLTLVGQTAQLQFRPVLSVLNPGDPGYATATVSASADAKDQQVTLGGVNSTDKAKYVLGPVAVDGSGVSGATAVVSPTTGQWSVSLDFKSDAQKAWGTFTGKLACNTGVTREIAIVLDNVVQSAPQVNTDVVCNTGIPGSTQITGNYTQTDAKNLALVLATGALPVKLTQSTVQSVSPTLGKASLRAGLIAGVLGLALVMIYVAIYYRSLGLQTWIGLLTFSAFTYALVVLLGRFIGWNLTLAGIAGLIVSIGITTDSYIVFFERVKEEVHAGKSLRSSIDRGFHSALRTLLTADSVTFIAAAILFLLAVGSVKGFALTLGLATALDVALFLALTYPLAALLARSQLFSSGRLIGMKAALEGSGSTGLLRKIYRSEFAIDFIAKRKRWLGFSAALVAISALALIPGIRGLKYGIDFRGGSIFKVPLSKNVSVPDLKSALKQAGVPTAEVQIFTDRLPPHARSANIQTESITNPAEQTKVLESLSKATGTQAAQISVDVVGSTWGAQITTKAVEGLIVFLIVVIIYMAFRLETKMSAAGIVALLHDLVITAGIYAISGLQVTPATVIAVLTILGYSLYDTVVVFDKIKENVILPSNAKKSYRQIANDAMNQTLMRSINTSLSTLIPVGSLLFVGSFLLGADTLRDLALALFVGIAAGTYSSIFVATPLLTIMKEKEPRYAALAAAKARIAAADARTDARTDARSDARADAKTGAQAKPTPSAALAKPTPTRPPARPARAEDKVDSTVGITPEGVEDSLNSDGEDDDEEPLEAPARSAASRPARPGGTPGTRVQPRRNSSRSKRKKGRR
ncbi:MAG TPA: protein translocase subunit SecF [Actinomycetota bacterium]|nr:protein translocase subunit SecF [Actinomycetota bacterium]